MAKSSLFEAFELKDLTVINLSPLKLAIYLIQGFHRDSANI